MEAYNGVLDKKTYDYNNIISNNLISNKIVLYLCTWIRFEDYGEQAFYIRRCRIR